jgi:hypothetical protein
MGPIRASFVPAHPGSARSEATASPDRAEQVQQHSWERTVANFHGMLRQECRRLGAVRDHWQDGAVRSRAAFPSMQRCGDAFSGDRGKPRPRGPEV